MDNKTRDKPWPTKNLIKCYKKSSYCINSLYRIELQKMNKGLKITEIC